MSLAKVKSISLKLIWNQESMYHYWKLQGVLIFPYGAEVQLFEGVTCHLSWYGYTSRMAQQLYIEYKSIFCIQVYG